ncbi:BnaCnng62020D [Brassica napus]|uniref:BnaCnng62020D protein n=2 Tax=Brassica TaxID=3705 RepID=A0A078JQP3_BRANA|nr:BnaCnng62020D [Brassica napus]VDD26003.1 unnamed protein product [Brassica oleracea]
MPLVFSLFFHKVVVCLLLQPNAPEMSLIDENPLTPRSIFIHMSNSQIHFSDLKAGPRLDQTPEVS